LDFDVFLNSVSGLLMKVSPLPDNEIERLAALHRYQILDSESEIDFDGIVELASQICGTSISLISLIDEHRQWFKAKVGIEVQETHRDLSFCAHAIHQNDIMTVYDASVDERFYDNPIVAGDPNIRFYSGMPLITEDGYKLGTLCVLDQKSRSITVDQQKSLKILAKQVINLLDLRLKNLDIKTQTKTLLETTENLERAEEQAGLGSWRLDVGTGKRYWSRQLFRMFGLDTDVVPDYDDFLKLIHPEDRHILMAESMKMQQGEEPEARIIRTNTDKLPLRFFLPTFRCLRDSKGVPIRFEGTLLDITLQRITELKLAESENRLHTIIQTEPECIKLVGPNCELLDMNPAGLAMIEAENINELLGKSILNLVDLNYKDAFLNLTRDVFNGIPGSLEFEITTLKGSKRWVETNVVPFKNTNGKIVSMLGVARDSTQRKSNERLLRNAEERYRGIFENALNGIYQTTPDGKFITANPAMAKIFGYENPQELISSVSDIGAQLYSDPIDRLKIMDLLRKDGKVIGYEIKTIKKNNELIWVLATIRCFYDDQGEIKYFEGTVKDITEQKKAKLEIKSEKEFAESFINSLPGVFYMYDSTGKFLRWNLNFETVTGYNAKEIERLHPSELFEEGEERDLIVSRIGEVFEKGYAEVETNFLLKDKQKIPYYFNGWKIKYENQDCLIGVGIDISARKKTENELRDSENKIRAFFHSTTDASVLVGMDMRVLAYNPAAEKLVKNFHGKEMAGGDLFLTLVNPETRTVIEDFQKKALRNEINQQEFLIPNINTGEKTWWQVAAMPAYDKDGSTFGVIFTWINIDGIKQAEIKLKKQFEELSKTNKELDLFVYSVSHDLRAPLASILGLLNITEIENTNPDIKSYLEMMRSSINKLDGFIKDILNYSKNARKEIQVKQIDFEQLINESVSDLKLNPGADRLKVIVKIVNSEPYFSDETRIGILFNNLISNAIKYQDYEKIASMASIDILVSSEKVIIRLSDNGIGISKDQLPKIFNMFYRASENSTGAGLGLYIVKETVMRLNGTITADSELLKSTMFEITLPNLKNRQ
jgi:PAS domain S-box-containing protein